MGGVAGALALTQRNSANTKQQRVAALQTQLSTIDATVNDLRTKCGAAMDASRQSVDALNALKAASIELMQKLDEAETEAEATAAIMEEATVLQRLENAVNSQKFADCRAVTSQGS